MADKDSMEIISALVDGELAEHDMHEAIRKIRSRHDHSCTWQRYHLIGDSLRNNIPTSIDPQLTHRISQALSTEPPLKAPAPSRIQPHKGVAIRPVAGFALAASVALTAFIGIGMFNTDNAGQTMAPLASNSAPTQPAPPETTPMVTVADNAPPTAGDRWNVDQPDVESKLNTYLSNHISAGMNSRMLPHVQLVGETYASPGQ